MGITAVDEVETPRDQSDEIVPVGTLYECEKDVLYHVRVSFDSCRGSAAKDNAQVHSFLAVKDCAPTVSLLSDFVF